MLTQETQRWRAGRASYRPAGEVINTRAYEVAPIDGAGADRGLDRLEQHRAQFNQRRCVVGRAHVRRRLAVAPRLRPRRQGRPLPARRARAREHRPLRGLVRLASSAGVCVLCSDGQDGADWVWVSVPAHAPLAVILDAADEAGIRADQVLQVKTSDGLYEFEAGPHFDSWSRLERFDPATKLWRAVRTNMSKEAA